MLVYHYCDSKYVIGQRRKNLAISILETCQFQYWSSVTLTVGDDIELTTCWVICSS